MYRDCCRNLSRFTALRVNGNTFWGGGANVWTDPNKTSARFCFIFHGSRLLLRLPNFPAVILMFRLISLCMMCWKVWWIMLKAFRGHFDNSLPALLQRKASEISYLERQHCWFQTLSCSPLKAIKLPASSLSHTKPAAARVARRHRRNIDTNFFRSQQK